MLYGPGNNGNLANKGFKLEGDEFRYGSDPKVRDHVGNEANEGPVVGSYHDECLSYALLGLENAGFRIVDRLGHSVFLADHGGDPVMLVVIIADGDAMVGLINAGHSADEVVVGLMDEPSFAAACAAGLLSVVVGHRVVPFEKIRIDAVLSYAYRDGANDKVVVAHKLGMAYGRDFIEAFGGATASGLSL